MGVPDTGNITGPLEWGDLIEEILPEHCVRITMLRDPQKGCDYRKIMIEDT